MENTPLFKFLEITKACDKLVEIYTNIRIWLQREGYTTESSKRIYNIPPEIFNLKYKMQNEIEKLKRDLNNYGILDNDLFIKYISKKLKEVDKKFPLIDELDD